jgi:hypothetical protein
MILCKKMCAFLSMLMLLGIDCSYGLKKSSPEPQDAVIRKGSKQLVKRVRLLGQDIGKFDMAQPCHKNFVKEKRNIWSKFSKIKEDVKQGDVQSNLKEKFNQLIRYWDAKVVDALVILEEKSQHFGANPVGCRWRTLVRMRETFRSDFKQGQAE